MPPLFLRRKEVVAYDEYIPGIVFDDTVWNVRYSSLEFQDKKIITLPASRVIIL
ncbi:hypothetical protein [Petroclostridium sp. X23]|uniref:hypothetical protein n=1 Tax=Petroclostridium sp. X23 TaxID=3045146 RepID=UPI0024AD1D49|nr:hypothetical protein [Petroclostridium sp. X23]WHH60461.1 hypothetical protein QKW49_07005 [Petroclostridium sp. X23]